MAYGFATHLWIHGTPEPDVLRTWLQAAVRDVKEEDLVALRLGDRTLLMPVNTAQRDQRWRSIGIIEAVSAQVKDHDWVSVDLMPDLDSWRVERRGGPALEWDPEGGD